MARPEANRWHLLDPAEPGGWAPVQSVSIVIPARTGQEQLDRTLTALACQTYPHHLLEVVVVDDGSVPALRIGTDMGDVITTIVRQEDDGRFGAGRARNRGAAQSDGEMLVFLDADIVTAPDLIDRYARWTALTDEAVLTGVLGFVDFSGLPADRVRAEIAAGTLTATLDNRVSDAQSWREKTFARTYDLTEDSDDLFRVVIGASLGVGRELFDAVGGFRELGLRGIEDVELGYRLHTAGCLLIVDRTARQWHQGRRYFDSAGAASAKRAREPYIEELIPVPGFRSYPARGLRRVPTLVVEVAEGTRSEISRTVDSMSGTEMVDVAFRVDPEGSPALSSADQRFRCLESFDPVDVVAVPFRFTVRAGATLAPTTCSAVVAALRESGVGVIHMLDEAWDELATAHRQRATAGTLRRTGRVDLDAAGRLFGARWLPAVDFGLGP